MVNLAPSSPAPPLNPKKLLFFFGAFPPTAGASKFPEDPTNPLADPTSYGACWRFDARYGDGAALCGLGTGAGG